MVRTGQEQDYARHSFFVVLLRLGQITLLRDPHSNCEDRVLQNHCEQHKCNVIREIHENLDTPTSILGKMFHNIFASRKQNPQHPQVPCFLQNCHIPEISSGTQIGMMSFLSSTALMFIGRKCLVTEHAILLHWAANVLIFMGKRAMLILFYTRIVKRSSVYLQAKGSNVFFTGIAILTLLEKVCFAVRKLHCFGSFRSHLGAVYFFDTGIVKRSSAKQNQCSGTEKR